MCKDKAERSFHFIGKSKQSWKEPSVEERAKQEVWLDSQAGNYFPYSQSALRRGWLCRRVVRHLGACLSLETKWSSGTWRKERGWLKIGQVNLMGTLHRLINGGKQLSQSFVRWQCECGSSVSGVILDKQGAILEFCLIHMWKGDSL